MTAKEQATKQGTPKTTGSATEARPGDVPPEEPAALKADIEQTREELGSTLEALVAKTDVKARIREKAAAKQRAVRQNPKPAVLSAAAAAAAVAAVALMVVWRRRRNR
jgi:hypothetical protein